jgi:hypothetical protein
MSTKRCGNLLDGMGRVRVPLKACGPHYYDLELEPWAAPVLAKTAGCDTAGP